MVEKKSFLQSNLGLRILTGVVAAPLVIGLILLSWLTTQLLMTAILVLALIEYIQLVRHEPSSTRNNILFGTLYLGVPMIAALWLRAQEDGAIWFLMMLVSNWTTDSGAYFVGRFFGKTLFAPNISPKKTWEGVVGGIIGGFLATLLFTLIVDFPLNTRVILIGILVPIATVLGDLLESKMKRRFSVKDSGHLLPGHGGVLDRIDGTLLALPTAALIVALVV